MASHAKASGSKDRQRNVEEMPVFPDTKSIPVTNTVVVIEIRLEATMRRSVFSAG